MADVNDIHAKSVHGSLWSTPPVSEQPVIILVRWRVVEVQTKDSQIERHFIGYNQKDQEGRVSSAIQNYNVETGQGVTRSGRVYQLIGEPGYDQDGEWVWANWTRVNQFLNEKDVSGEFRQLASDTPSTHADRGSQ